MKFTLTSISLVLILTGCASTSRLTTQALGAAGGAGLANVLSDGDPLMTAAGAAGGLLVGEGINRAQDQKAVKSYNTGYDKGRSDAVKQQYWLLVDQQKGSGGEAGEDISLIDLPLPDRMPDGTLFHPGSTRTLRIQE